MFTMQWQTARASAYSLAGRCFDCAFHVCSSNNIMIEWDATARPRWNLNNLTFVIKMPQMNAFSQQSTKRNIIKRIVRCGVACRPKKAIERKFYRTSFKIVIRINRWSAFQRHFVNSKCQINCLFVAMMAWQRTHSMHRESLDCVILSCFECVYISTEFDSVIIPFGWPFLSLSSTERTH